MMEIKKKKTLVLTQRTDTTKQIIIINTYEEQLNEYFVICFEQTLFIISDSNLHQVSNFINKVLF